MKGSTLIWVGLGLVAAGGAAYLLFGKQIKGAFQQSGMPLNQYVQNAAQQGTNITQLVQSDPSLQAEIQKQATQAGVNNLFTATKFAKSIFQ